MDCFFAREAQFSVSRPEKLKRGRGVIKWKSADCMTEMPPKATDSGGRGQIAQPPRGPRT